MSVFTQYPSLFRPRNSPDVFECLSSDKSIPMPFSHSNHPPPSSSPINHAKNTLSFVTIVTPLAANPSKSPNICRPFGCRLVGHCIAYEWAIHATNTELLSAEHFPNAVKTISKRRQNHLETPSNHPRNATKILLLIPHLFSLKENFATLKGRKKPQPL